VGKSGNGRTVGEGIVRGTDTSEQEDAISTEKVQLPYPIFHQPSWHLSTFRLSTGPPGR
jgi:hypothetical protein